MGTVFGERAGTGQDVVKATLDRIRHAYSVSDYQIVCFSGG